MLSRLILLACAGAACLAAEPALAADAAPWKPSFTTNVRGKDRQFVEAGGRTYILASLDELSGTTLNGQDVALIAKLRRLPGERFGLYRVDGLVLESTDNLLAGRLDGDNVHLAGMLKGTGAQRTLLVQVAGPAPSDAQMLTARMAGIQDDEWDRRLGVVNWCRDQARTAGNIDTWTASAEQLLGKIIADMAARAGERKDLGLLTRAVDLALNQTKDPGLAARLASPTWIREHGGAPADALARRMRGLGFALYKEQWLPRPQAAEREFEDRFAALAWKDAEGFYQLGRWADDNAEALPRARERSWRCYQAGNQADPNHAGILRELGMKPPTGGTEPAPATSGEAIDLIDPETRAKVPAPPGWKRGKPQGGDVTWLDPASDTALISLRLLRQPLDLDAAWTLLEGEARARNGFAEVGRTDDVVGNRRIRSLRSTWNEAGQERFAIAYLVPLGEGRPAVLIDGRGLPSDQQRLEEVVAATAAGATLQDDAPAAP